MEFTTVKSLAMHATAVLLRAQVTVRHGSMPQYVSVVNSTSGQADATMSDHETPHMTCSKQEQQAHDKTEMTTSTENRC